MQKRTIYLIGFMGSGKSTLGKVLARLLNYSFIDLDHYIEKKEGLTVAEIFSRHGEERFRALERLSIHETAQKGHAVVATGGGAPCFFDNMDFMNQHGTTIYLKISPENLARRLAPARAHRPLLADKSENELLTFIKQRLEERTPFYQRANFVADTETLSPEETARYIVQSITHEDQ
ncbi:MAG: shikimate kinase [Marinilabiliaceae bacterium]